VQSVLIRIFCFICVSAFSVYAQKYSKDADSYVDWAWEGEFKPYFEFTYGYAQPMQKLFSGTFAPIGQYEVKLGYSDINLFRSFILGMDERYVFGSYAKPDYNFVDEDVTGVTNEATRFGFGNRLGFGYDISAIQLLPYNNIQYVWTKVNPIDSSDIERADRNILDRYSGVFRFGHSGEAGVKLQIAKSIGVIAGFEYAVVYPRHIFWPWLGSHIIQSTALGMVSVFSEDIVNSSPIFGPLMYFLLKNGVMYALYQGYRDKMNWPFNSETPLTFETYKLGVSLTF
jgi:hypothetical protein